MWVNSVMSEVFEVLGDVVFDSVVRLIQLYREYFESVGRGLGKGLVWVLFESVERVDGV